MKLGLAFFPTGESLRPERLAELAENRGFDVLLFAEHTHIPSSRETPFPGGAEIPKKYPRTLDPFVALTAAAVVTGTIRLGTGVCLLAQRDPIVTAKAVASIDVLSGGRFEFGVGAGWNVEEMSNHGVRSSERFDVVREKVEAMKEIWTRDSASYAGTHVHFDQIWSWPKPVQRPHPPILVGGVGPRVIDRVVSYGDAWLPNRTEGLGERMAQLERVSAERGVSAVPTTTVYAAPPDLASLRQIAGAGAERAVLMLESGIPTEVEDEIDRLSALVEQLA
ncbi:MAG TPA: LLM class F420-dependent oxidoreductase [Solirubrobacterales bacterium]|jgi:probable F420-dependent oxidoreductase|nr:LLM class F420-dependent oxidoreductase [Solirubrobacterales bacterium]